MNVLNQTMNERFAIYNGDCVETLKGIPDNSIHLLVTSSPFSSLYTYSNSDRDMGNSKGDEEFFAHFDYLCEELYRIMMPGRIMVFHCMDIPRMKERDGVIGLKDFPSMILRSLERVGFIYHSKVTIFKSPVTEMQRTKALGLLHKQIKKDSAMSRQGIPDYLVVVRKPGENPERVTHTNESFPVNVWQRYASPVWMDIKQSDTLQRKSARAEKDERHICPLQLEVIKRCIELWTNLNDIVLDPFAGIGSTNYVALRMNRRTVGVELKESYYVQAAANCQNALNEMTLTDLYDEIETDPEDITSDDVVSETKTETQIMFDIPDIPNILSDLGLSNTIDEIDELDFALGQ